MVSIDGDKITKQPKKNWFKRLGWILPLFFFIKGLLWLIIPVILAYYGLD
jgi:cytochrome c-type biogenesis protein CcmH/NrfF